MYKIKFCYKIEKKEKEKQNVITICTNLNSLQLSHYERPFNITYIQIKQANK